MNVYILIKKLTFVALVSIVGINYSFAYNASASDPDLSGTYCSSPESNRTILKLESNGTVYYNQKISAQGVPACSYDPHYLLTGNGHWKYTKSKTVSILLPGFLDLTCTAESMDKLNCGNEGEFTRN